jgi:hypothetical protein
MMEIGVALAKLAAISFMGTSLMDMLRVLFAPQQTPLFANMLMSAATFDVFILRPWQHFLEVI